MILTNPILYFSIGETDYYIDGEYLVQDGFSFTYQRSNGLDSSSNKITCGVRPNYPDINEILTTRENDIPYYLVDDNVTIATGRINPKLDWTVTNKGESVYKLTLEGNDYLLDTIFEDETFLEGSPSELLETIADMCGLEIGEDFPTSMSTLSYSSLVKKDSKVKDALNGLCKEIGYVYSFNEEGELCVSPLINDDSELIELDGDSLSNIKLTRDLVQYRNITGKYNVYDKLEHAVIFDCNENTSEEHPYCYLQLEAGVGKTYYKNGTTVTASLPYNTEYSEVVSIDSIDPKSEWTCHPLTATTATITYDMSKKDSKNLNIQITNNSSIAQIVTRFTVTGTVHAKKEEVETVNGIFDNVTSSKDMLKVEDVWAHSKTEHEKYMTHLIRYYGYCNYKYSFNSLEDIELGSKVKLTDDVRSGKSQTVIITKKSWSNRESSIQYKYEGFSISEMEITPVFVETSSYSSIGGGQSTANSVDYIVYEYGVSSRQNVEPTVWTETQPTLTSNDKYLWRKETIYFTRSAPQTTVSITGVYGDTGESGGSYLFEVTGTSEFQYDATKTGNQTLKYQVRVDGYDITETDWLTVSISETGITYNLTRKSNYYEVALTVPYKASYENFTVTFHLNLETSEQPTPQDVVFNLKAVDVTPYMFEAEGATTFKVDKRSRDSQIINYNVRVNGYTPSDTGWITMSTVPSTIAHSLDIEGGVVTGQITIPLLNSFNDVSVTFHLNKTLTREPQPKDATVYLKPVDITEYDRYMGTMDYVNPRSALPIDNYITGNGFDVPSLSVLDWAEVDRIDGVTEKTNSTITSSIINGVQSSNGVSHSIVFPTVILRSVNEIVDSYIPNTKKTLRRLGHVYLETLTWTQETSGVWKSTSLSDIKYLSSSTEVGNYLSENYELSSISEQTSGKIAVGQNFIRVISSTYPTGEFIYELTDPVYIGSAFLEGTWGNQGVGEVIDYSSLTFYYNDGVSYNVSNDVEIIYPSNGRWGNTVGEQTVIWRYVDGVGNTVYYRKTAMVYEVVKNPLIEGNWGNMQYTYTDVDSTGLTFKATVRGIVTDVTNSVILVTPSGGKWSGSIGSQDAQWTYTTGSSTIYFTKTANVQDSLKNPVIEGDWANTQWSYCDADTVGLTFKVTLKGVVTDVTSSVVMTVPPSGEWTSAGNQTAYWQYAYGGDTVTFHKNVTVLPVVQNPTIEGDWANPQIYGKAVDPTGLRFFADVKGVRTDVSGDVVLESPITGDWYVSTGGTQTAEWEYQYMDKALAYVRFTKDAEVKVNTLTYLDGTVTTNVNTYLWLQNIPNVNNLVKIEGYIYKQVLSNTTGVYDADELAYVYLPYVTEVGVNGLYSTRASSKGTVTFELPRVTSYGGINDFMVSMILPPMEYVIGTETSTVCRLDVENCFIVNYSDNVLYVPDNLVNQYKNSEGWEDIYENGIISIKGISERPSSNNLLRTVNRVRAMAPSSSEEPSTDSFLKITDGCTVSTLPVGSKGIITLHYLTEVRV